MSAKAEPHDLRHSQHEQTKATASEQIVQSRESPQSQAASDYRPLNIESSSHGILEPEPTAVAPANLTELATATSTATPCPALPNLRSNPSCSCTASTTSVLSPATLFYSPGRSKPLEFLSPDVLPPARLYGEDQEPSCSNIPFAKDECVSQKHAHCSLL